MSPSTAPSRPALPWQPVLLVLGLAGYALLSNWLMVHAADAPFTVALLFGPLLLAIGAMGWQRRSTLTLVACAVLLAVLAWVVWRGGVGHAQRMYVLQHAAIHVTLAWSFALTLRGDAEPLITGLARGVHGRLGQDFTPAMVAYTRSLTALWAAYFAGMVVVSLLLYALAPWPVWSLYCTVLTPVSVGLLFVAEHLWRYHRHPEFPRVSMQAAIDAYRRSGQGAAT